MNHCNWQHWLDRIYNLRREGVWRVSRRLDDRIHGQRELLKLSGKPVIPPGEEKFYPAFEGLRWREEKLAGAG